MIQFLDHDMQLFRSPCETRRRRQLAWRFQRTSVHGGSRDMRRYLKQGCPMDEVMRVAR